MREDIRGDKKAIPYNLEYYLTKSQLTANSILKQLGWTLCFIRRPAFAIPTVVMVDTSGKRFAILTRDGDLDTETPLKVRA